MEFDDLKKILELFAANNIDKLDLQHEGFSLKLSKKKGQVVMAPVEARVQVPEFPASGAPAADEEEGLNFVNSPIVGTFYRAPNPNSEAFVQVGDRIKPGQTLCIVEAMKLMNEIQADHAGVITKIFVDNGQGVEFGQKLFAVKP